MKKAWGINDFLAKKFKTYKFDGLWLESFGEPEINFRMLIPGQKKNGKTNFAIMLAKYLAGFGKVLYNSHEQGISKTLQDVIKIYNLQEVAGKIMFQKYTFEEMVQYLSQKGSPRFVIIDSQHYMKLTIDQYKRLVELFPRKSFIVICWGDKSGEPKGDAAEALSFMVDIICPIVHFVAYPRSRFGGNKPFDFCDPDRMPPRPTESKSKQLQTTLFN